MISSFSLFIGVSYNGYAESQYNAGKKILDSFILGNRGSAHNSNDNDSDDANSADSGGDEYNYSKDHVNLDYDDYDYSHYNFDHSFDTNYNLDNTQDGISEHVRLLGGSNNQDDYERLLNNDRHHSSSHREVGQDDDRMDGEEGQGEGGNDDGGEFESNSQMATRSLRKCGGCLSASFLVVAILTVLAGIFNIVLFAIEDLSVSNCKLETWLPFHGVATSVWVVAAYFSHQAVPCLGAIVFTAASSGALTTLITGTVFMAHAINSRDVLIGGTGDQCPGIVWHTGVYLYVLSMCVVCLYVPIMVWVSNQCICMCV